MRGAEEFCRLLELEEDIIRDIAELEGKVCRELGDKILLLAREALAEGITNERFIDLLKTSEDCGAAIGEHKYRMQMIFAYYCFSLMEEKYERAGISHDVYLETIKDFRFRVYECREVYHFNGIFVAWWYYFICNLSIHKIDELEFERTVAEFDYDGKGVTVRKGEPIIAIHIPPKFRMNRATVTKAIKESYKYYGFSGKVAYQCESWLLYPDFENVFVVGGNVMEFRSFFDVIGSTDQESFENCWRVFKVGEIDSLDTLPTDTRLQRNMLKHLREGKKTGDGFGVLVFDGERIL